jgi:outer membrane protein TolC
MTMKMLGLSQKLPYPGKRRLRQDIAISDAESVSYAYQETVNRVVRDVKVTYLDLALIRESARLVGKNEQMLEQFLDIAEAWYRVGQGSESDVLKAQTQLSTIGDELLRLGRERQIIDAELNRALGRQAGLVQVIPNMPGLPEVPLNLGRLRESALRDRPQLRALQSLVTGNEKALSLAGKAYYPDFDVRLSYGQRDDTPGGMPREDMITLSVAVTLPVWRKTRLAPGVAEAAAMHEQALEMLKAQRNEVSAELRRQVANAEQNLRSARLYQSGILPQARLAVEAALAAYKVNRVDFLTLLDSQITVFDFEINHAGAVVGYHKALAEIDFIVGKPPL